MGKEEMIILIGGASHTGKTLLSQKLMEKYKYPYLSIDHLKMGLIRSGNTNLTPEDDDELTIYLWSIIKEIIKTAIENNQNLIIEGVYIPFDWENDFSREYLKDIRYYCIIMSKEYIENRFSDIKGYADIIEKRTDDYFCSWEILAQENYKNLKACQEYGHNYILIDGDYDSDMKRYFSAYDK